MSSVARNCEAIKGDGKRCQNKAKNGSQWCAAHDPARSEARKLAASRGGKRGGRGRAGVSGEIQEIKAELRKIARLAPGSEETKGYSVAVQALNVLLRAMSEEREQRYAGELEERLKATEKALEETKAHGQSA